MLDVKTPFTAKTLRTAYYKKALHFHPDKNKDAGATERFHAASEANEYLRTYLEIEEAEDNADGEVYESVLSRLFSSVFDEPTHGAVFIAICGQIRGKSWDLALRTFESLDRKTAVEVVEYITAFQDVLGLDNATIERFRSKISLVETEHVVLNPKLRNLLNKEVYCLDLSGDLLYIPLWHEEISFDLSCGPVVVTNKLQLPDNVAIDHNNDLHVHVRYGIGDAFLKGHVPINLAEKVFELPARELHIRAQQTARIPGRGAPRINPHNLLDANQIGDIVVHLELY
tara:strand:+ start:5225 stop:6079 length:855 start_codon:yes stop_codon:yes gene_type:complete